MNRETILEILEEVKFIIDCKIDHKNKIVILAEDVDSLTIILDNHFYYFNIVVLDGGIIRCSKKLFNKSLTQLSEVVRNFDDCYELANYVINNYQIGVSND